MEALILQKVGVEDPGETNTGPPQQPGSQKLKESVVSCPRGCSLGKTHIREEVGDEAAGVRPPCSVASSWGQG